MNATSRKLRQLIGRIPGAHLARSAAVDRQSEAVRLDLRPPAPAQGRGRLSMARRLLRAPRNLFSAAWDRWFPADRFLKSCASIVHVGANSGQERTLYSYYDLEVIWIEPIWAVYEQLVSNIKPYPKQTAIQALLTDRARETVTLHIANNSGASSSIFDLALHKDIWPEVGYVDHVQMHTETLDRLLEGGAVRLPVDAIILDTQGSELLVLKGAETLLHQATYVKVEASDFESYRGGATVETIEKFLKGFDFRVVQKKQFATHPSGGGYYDLLFKRSSRRRLGTMAIKRLFGERLLGHIDYYRGEAWGAPFNSQKARTALFRALMERISPVAIVETGTYLGTTTEFFAESGVPVFSAESDPRVYGFAKARLRSRRNVTLLRGDSREALAQLFDGILQPFASLPLFFYLDAHWNTDLPLAEELEIIFSRCPAAIVMIDDFKVPFDAGYGYDDYGPDKALTADYGTQAMHQHGLYAFYPSTPAIEETGARRGCVVLVKDGMHCAKLMDLSLLRTAVCQGGDVSRLKRHALPHAR